MPTVSRIKPFVKWAGGKTQLLPFLNIVMSIYYKNYWEPFLGGGSVFLNLLPQKAILSDLNEELIIAWQTLKTDSIAVIKLLKKYVKALQTDKKDFYYYLRQQDINLLDHVQKTARFLFLNKTCFNGLYRVNSKNQFNTPFNGKVDISLSNLINETNLQKIITFLNQHDIKFFHQDFKLMIAKTKKDDLLFCDPPYDSDTSTFNSYHAQGFNKNHQEELFQALQAAHLRGVKWVLTNHDTKLIKRLYQPFYFVKIPVDRFINAHSENRKNHTYETIITNYELSDEQKKQIDHLLFLKELKNTSYFLKDYVPWEKVDNFIFQKQAIIKKWDSLKSFTSQEFFHKFDLCWEKDPSTFEFLPILIANNCFFRNEKFIYFNHNHKEIIFDHRYKNIVIDFIKESKLLDKFFLNPLYEQNIASYLAGIFIGLSSHARKNKSGLFLPQLIADILTTRQISFQTEINLKDILKESVLTENKRIDFMFTKNQITYFLECSFFNVSGSKINSELNRMLAFSNTINKFKKYKFIYVIEGPGLKKNNLLVSKILNETNNFFNIDRFQKFLNYDYNLF